MVKWVRFVYQVGLVRESDGLLCVGWNEFVCQMDCRVLGGMGPCVGEFCFVGLVGWIECVMAGCVGFDGVGQNGLTY